MKAATLLMVALALPGCGMRTASERQMTTYAIIGAAVLTGLVIGIASDPPRPAATPDAMRPGAAR